MSDEADRESNPPDESDATEERRLDALLVGLSGFVIVYLLAHLVAFHYGRDQGIYAVVADALVHGKPPYKAAWDFKPPGIFFVYGFARLLLGTGVHAVRVVEALAYASLVGAFGVFSRRHVGDWRPGLVGGALAVLTHVQLEFWHTGQPESFGAVALAWALVSATYEPDATDPRATLRRRLALVGAGALYAFASLLKPPLGGGFLVSLGFVAWRAWRKDRDPRALLEPVVCFAIGGLLPVALTWSYFVGKGAWGDLYQTLFVFTPNYTKLGYRSEWLIGFIFLAVEQWTFTFSAFNVFGLALLLGLPRLDERERLGAAHVMGVVAFQLVGVALQAKFFPYHYGAALPFAGLLAGWGYWKLWLLARRSIPGLVAYGAMIYVLHDARTATRDVEDGFWTRCRLRLDALREPDARTEIADHLYSVADVNAEANRLTAEWIAAHTSANDSIYVWGFEPGIYDLARRRPATRYVYDVPQRVSWGRDESRRVLMEDLDRDPPAVIVVERRDVFPVVTGDNLDSADSLRSFPALRDRIQAQYEIATVIEDLTIYVRRSRPVDPG